MLVITNEHTVNGAATMFYEGVQDEVAHRFNGSSYYVIPSSTNEMLAIKDTGEEEYTALERMLRHMNSVAVPDDEVLSYNVFHYDAQDKIFEKASDYEDRMVMKLFDQHFENLMKRIESDSEISTESPRSENKSHSFSMKM